MWTTRLLLVLATLGGCAAGKGTDPATGTDTGEPGGDTATAPTEDACGPDVVPLAIATCVETTAVLDPSVTTTGTYGWGGYTSDVLGGTGTVTEVGGPLDEVPGSYPVGIFPPCGAEHPQQV